MATQTQGALEALAVGTRNNSVGSTVNAEGNHQGATLVALSLPWNSEVGRMQQTYQGATLTPVAPVAAMPTTASHLSLYCPAGSNTKSLVIHRITAYCVVSAAAVIQTCLAYQVTTLSVTSITGTATSGPTGITGNNVSIATLKSAVTTVANGTWITIGQSQNFGAQTPTIAMALDSGDLGGIPIIQPGMHLDMAVLCSAAASATFNLAVVWSEVQC